MFQEGLSPSSPRSLDLSGKVSRESYDTGSVSSLFTLPPSLLLSPFLPQSLSRLYHTDYMLHLCSLDLSNNYLTSLSNVENLVCLDTLVVDDNKLEELPPGMEQLQLLRVLSIRNNSILLFTTSLHAAKILCCMCIYLQRDT